MSAPVNLSDGLAGDTRALDDLKRAARNDPRAATKKAAQQFEALFLQRVLKSMRDAMPKSGMLDSQAGEMYSGMLDQQLAMKLADSGTGLAALIEKQLLRQTGAETLGVGSRLSGATATGAELHVIPSGARNPRTAAVEIPRFARNDNAVATDPRGATSGASSPDTRLSTPDASPSDARRSFLTRHWDAALAAQRATGIPARFVVSQAALESGWGKHEIKGKDGLPSHNLFGIKAGANWTGRTVDVVTTEYENGAAKKVVEKFRAYNNYGEAFRDWAQLLAANPRYAGVVQGAGSADTRQAANAFAQGLQRAGYATDPQYAAKLTAVIGATARLRGVA